MSSIDDIRKAYPHLGIAVYELTPGGVVTVEMHTPERMFTFKAPTVEAALLKAFPPEPEEIAPDPINVFD